MPLFYHICEWLLVIALIGLIGTLIWIVVAAIQIKNAVMADAKRLYEPPVRSVKSIIATGKGIAQKEKLRVQRVGVVAKGTTAVVKEAAGDVKAAAQSIHPSDLEPVKADFLFILQNISQITQFLRVLSGQKTPTR